MGLKEHETGDDNGFPIGINHDGEIVSMTGTFLWDKEVKMFVSSERTFRQVDLGEQLARFYESSDSVPPEDY